MVNATVDNTPVSIVLDGGQSTTVPSNETWKVTINISSANGGATGLRIDGIGTFVGKLGSGANQQIDAVLTGGQTIAEIKNSTGSAIYIAGFVVNN
jgi:hypothetical protein